jgi:hypothetical protein
MQQTTPIQKLKALITQRKESFLLLDENQKSFSNYLNLLKEIPDDWSPENRIKEESIQKQIRKLFSIKKPLDQIPQDNVALLNLNKIIEDPLDNLDNKKNITAIEDALERVKQWKVIIEKTESCLKDEKFYSLINPIVAISTESSSENRKKIEPCFSIVVIINDTSLVQLKISADEIQRIQRALRKDIIDIKLVQNTHVEFTFHSIRELICVQLDSYKDAKYLQEKVHELRNAPFFRKPNR